VMQWKIEEAEKQAGLARLAAEKAEARRAEAARQREQEELRRAEQEQRRADRAPPDLQALVMAHATFDDAGNMVGGYNNITEEAWAQYHNRLKEWQTKVKHGELK